MFVWNPALHIFSSSALYVTIITEVKISLTPGHPPTFPHSTPTPRTYTHAYTHQPDCRQWWGLVTDVWVKI